MSRVQPRPLPLVLEIQRATHVIGLELEGALAGLHLSQGEAHVLTLLARSGREPIATLQRGLRHRASTLTGIIDRLESRSLVVRLINPADRRSFIIQLTDEGVAAAAAVARVMDDIELRMTTRHSTRQLAAFRTVLETLATESEHETVANDRTPGGAQ